MVEGESYYTIRRWVVVYSIEIIYKHSGQGFSNNCENDFKHIVWVEIDG